MIFDNYFKNISTPVVICKNDAGKTIVYENRSAIRLLNPLASTGRLETGNFSFKELLQMPVPAWHEFTELLDRNGDIPGYNTKVTIYSGEQFFVNLAANTLTVEDETYLQISVLGMERRNQTTDYMDALDSVFRISHEIRDAQVAIENILLFTGEWTQASRVYLVEAVSETEVTMTYEWCEQGIESARAERNRIAKAACYYDQVIAKGLAVTDDVGKLPEENRRYLEAQGIKSFVMIPVMSPEGALGYLGIDDCINCRVWTQKEIKFFKNIADMLSSLILRRNTENGLRYGLDVLSVVTNNLDNIIFVTDIRSRKILFANNALAAVPGVPPEALKGRVVDDVLREHNIDQDYKNPLDFMVDEDGNIIKREYKWEYRNPSSGKWYTVQDAIIQWIDGRDAQIETATEITYQKEHEAELEYVASMDMMTKAYNREWGRRLLKNILRDNRADQDNVLVFIDLDRLKMTNDKYGHSAGDDMILSVVNIIRACTRRSDVLCRWGGDEFILIIRANEAQAERVMHKICKRLEEYNCNSEHEYEVSFSYGIVRITEAYKNIDELISAADRRMYDHKMRLHKERE